MLASIRIARLHLVNHMIICQLTFNPKQHHFTCRAFTSRRKFAACKKILAFGLTSAGFSSAGTAGSVSWGGGDWRWELPGLGARELCLEAACVEDWVTGFGPGFPTGVAELITTDGGGPAIGGAEGSAEVSPVPGTGSSRTTSSTENEKQRKWSLPVGLLFPFSPCRLILESDFSTDWRQAEGYTAKLNLHRSKKEQYYQTALSIG